MERILGGKEQDARRLGGAEAAEAGGAGGDRNGEVESEKRFTALGLATDDADRLSTPERLNEPALFGRLRGQLAGREKGQGHRRLPALRGAGAPQTCRKSCSSSRGSLSRTAAASRSAPRFMSRR